ncbi:hypothetical protein Q7P37_002435 [Cladosporium fusiforme]
MGSFQACFQKVPAIGQSKGGASAFSKEQLLATSLKSGIAGLACSSGQTIDKLMKTSPRGGVISLLDDTWYVSISRGSWNALDEEIGSDLKRSFKGARQILFMPLFDAVHDRTATVFFGWLGNFTRVYSEKSDLVSLSVFCTTTMSEAHRLESHRAQRVKADFLGSVSHEMRSPLHNVLGNLELLLQTDCSNEQRGLAIDARLGATQLLDTIDNILQYSRITSAPDSRSDMDLTADQSQSDSESPKIIGPRRSRASSRVVTMDLVSVCEEVVEETTRHMRFLESVVSPVEGVGTRDLAWPTKLDEESKSAAKDPFTVVMLDAVVTDHVWLPKDTELRIIVANLLSNAIKYTRFGCCVRVSARIESETVKLIVYDCGFGMSENFVNHHLYLPFAQQDPVASGLGLGLPLVKHNVDKLGATIHIETDQAFGTAATVEIPIPALTDDTSRQSITICEGDEGTNAIHFVPRRQDVELPNLKASFFAPRAWVYRHDARDKRSIDLVFDSLTATLRQWFQPFISIWHSHGEQTLPDIIFVTQRDLEEFQKESGEAFANVKKVVICAAVGKDSEQDRQKISEASTLADALIVGAVLPSKLWQVISGYFPYIHSQDGDAGEGAKTSSPQDMEKDDDLPGEPNMDHQSVQNTEREADASTSSETPVKPDGVTTNTWLVTYRNQSQVATSEHADDSTSPERKTDNDNEETVPTTDNSQTAADSTTSRQTPNTDECKLASPAPQNAPSPETPLQPRLLIVDDNSINLKMLGMFLQKCGVPGGAITAVSGGREAIEAFREATTRKDSIGLGFDIILMDLSMPEVSGFEATAGIRGMESLSNTLRPAYIIALTSLVSEKDRQAAFEAGVDGYVTKPAGMKGVRQILDEWEAKVIQH